MHDVTRELARLRKSEEAAWGLIANAYGGNWDLASELSGWKKAAERWRDNYHTSTRPCIPRTPEEPRGELIMSQSPKTLHNSDISGARENVSDLQIYGDDLWTLLCKASSASEGWMKSTKAMEIEGPSACAGVRYVKGCLVQVTTQQGDHVAEALTFIPNVQITVNEKSSYLIGN